MTDVHIELAKKVKKKTSAIAQYQEMDQRREELISQLIVSYKSNKKIELTELNQWTSIMNAFAVANQLPTRKIVTAEMFAAYIKNLQ